jgi:Flp pilus assembly protein TadG
MSTAIRSRRLYRSVRSQLRALRSCAKGASAAEFAIVVPVMGVLLTGTVDLAQLANQGLYLDAAVRAGASFALACNPQAYTGCATKITSAITGYATNLGGTVAVSFPSAEGATTAWYPQHCTWDNATTVVTCDNNAVGGACDPAQAQCPKHFYVKIEAVQTPPAPLLPFPIPPLKRTLTVRVL